MNIDNMNLLEKLLKSNSLQEIIEKSDEKSKRKFIEFTKGTLGEDASKWDQLWNIPILASYECDSLISADLNEDEKDIVLDVLMTDVEEQIADEISKGAAEAACIPFEYFTDEKGNNDEIVQRAIKNNRFSTAIFYFIPEIKKKLKEFTEEVEEPLSIDELKSYFIGYIGKVFTHERCHANAIYRTKDAQNANVTIYGARGTYDSFEEPEKIHFYGTQDEVLTDTVAIMMQKYKEGDSVEDCLLKVIEERGEKNPYKDIDDKTTLLLMSLFPEDITKWAVLGAHEGRKYNNLIEEKVREVFGESSESLIENGLINVKNKVENYFINMDKSNLSVEQLAKRIRMLQLMGLDKNKLLDISKKGEKEDLEL